MAAQLLGKYVVWGNPGTVAYTGMLAASNKPRGASVKATTRVSDARDGSGDIFATKVTHDTDTLTVTLFPFSGTDLAGAKSAVVRPTAGDTLAISATGLSGYDGNWNVIDPGEISIPDSDSDPISITGVTCRRVSADNAAPAAQTKLS